MEREYPNLEEYINVFVECGLLSESSKKIVSILINQAFAQGFEDARNKIQRGINDVLKI